MGGKEQAQSTGSACTGFVHRVRSAASGLAGSARQVTQPLRGAPGSAVASRDCFVLVLRNWTPGLRALARYFYTPSTLFLILRQGLAKLFGRLEFNPPASASQRRFQSTACREGRETWLTGLFRVLAAAGGVGRVRLVRREKLEAEFPVLARKFSPKIT